MHLGIYILENTWWRAPNCHKTTCLHNPPPFWLRFVGFISEGPAKNRGTQSSEGEIILAFGSDPASDPWSLTPTSVSPPNCWTATASFFKLPKALLNQLVLGQTSSLQQPAVAHHHIIWHLCLQMTPDPLVIYGEICHDLSISARHLQQFRWILICRL